MSDEDLKLLVLGMGSASDKKIFDATSLGGKSIDEYLNSKGIRVYHQRGPDKSGSKGYLITSIHRVTEDSIEYARDLKKIALAGPRISALFAGGLAFALPGVVAAESVVVPTIAVPMDIDAFYNVYRTPDGTPVGVVSISALANGILLSEKVLNHSSSLDVNLIVKGNCPSEGKLAESLYHFLGRFSQPKDTNGHYEGLTICLTDDPLFLVDLDKRVELGICGFEKNIATTEGLSTSHMLENSMMIGRPANLALMAARIVGLTEKIIQPRLVEFRAKEAAGYEKRIPIEWTDFR